MADLREPPRYLVESGAPISEKPLLLDAFGQHVRERPSDKSVVFLEDGEEIADEATNMELAARAWSVAARVAGHAGERALLIFPAGIDFVASFLGCLWAGVIPVPAPLSGSHRHSMGRLGAIMSAAGCGLVVAPERLFDLLGRRLDGCFAGKMVFVPPGCGVASSPTPLTSPRPSDLAYLQYTSGSTSSPRGVMVTHGALQKNLEAMHKRWNFCDGVMVNWMPHFHDFGLVFGIVQPLYMGVPCVLMPPSSFIQKPSRWLRAISNHRGTHSGSPNFGYQLCLDSIADGELRGLDLSSWRVAVNGAEPIRAKTLQRFGERMSEFGFAGNVFSPAYGLAEAVLFVASESCGDQPVVLNVDTSALTEGHLEPSDSGTVNAKTLVACGKTEGSGVRIVHPESRKLLPDGRVGEIWVSASEAAAGYWGDLEASTATFGAETISGEGPFLRTGDLGAVRYGRLYITGRLKDLIIIRGANHYPQDIEFTATESHEALRPSGAAAFSVDDDGVERVVLVHELRKGSLNADAVQIASTIRAAVASEHEIPVDQVVLVAPYRVPKTSSGKVMRRACKDAWLSGQLDPIAVIGPHVGQRPCPPDQPRDKTEREVIDAFRQSLGIADIAPDDDLLEFGADSLNIARAFALLSERFGRTLPPSLVFEASTAREIARKISAGAQETGRSRIVEVQAGNSGMPLFCVHTLSGSVLRYGALARLLGHAQQVYGIEASGIDGSEPPLTSVKRMADEYVQAMRRVQPSGPYMLAGQCFGGIVAYEMARRLNNLSEEVRLLVLFDAVCHPAVTGGWRRALGVLLRGWLHRLRIGRKILGRRLLRLVLGENVRRFPSITSASKAAGQTHIPGPYGGRIVYFQATRFRSRASPEERLAGWRRLAAGGLAVHVVPCYHTKILSYPAVQEVARKLRPCLEEIQQRSTGC